MEQLEQEDLDKVIKEQNGHGAKGESSFVIKDDGITIESLLVSNCVCNRLSICKHVKLVFLCIFHITAPISKYCINSLLL